jgi:hypothetical protein
MHSKNYHSKVETDGLEDLRMEEHMQTLQKESKYYSNNDDTAIKKKLFEHYDQVPSTQNSNVDNASTSLLNQLHDAIQSYRPSFKDALPKRKPNYLSTNLEMEKPEISAIHEDEPS